MKKLILIVLGFSALSTALPAHETLNVKLDEGLRYQYAKDSNRQIQLADVQATSGDTYDPASFDPDVTNVYHLFTRTNPTISQPIMYKNSNLLLQSSFNSNRRTIILFHGSMGSPTSNFVRAVVPALLSVEDLNVIAIDWTIGANSLNYRLVNWNTVKSGQAVARFIEWLNQERGSTLEQFHLIGHGVGGHQAGIVGRNLNGQISYITGLNPSLIGWVNNVDRLSPNDAVYTEVLHTNFIHGYLGDLAQVDFYFNGAISMPGCESNECDHEMSYLYFAESITSGGFTGRECLNYYAALLRMCDFHPGRLMMGGLIPKTGNAGVYFLETNADPPYSQG
ncbi:unnamed protein product [Leptosia nina]|uniref:Lipase domain-containing protein n=1 Tax=Leptosia nina TaxID=320188 RepID=A0AAV1J7V8_9NEOP